MKLINSVVQGSLDKGYISQDQAPWLRYALEKQTISFFATITILLIGIFISSLGTSVAFYISFCLLRSRTNGIHAKSFWRCLAWSVLSEAFFLGVLHRRWNDGIAFLLLSISAIIIWSLAPYNHPKMDLSSLEKMACAISAKKRLIFLVLTAALMHLLELDLLKEGVMLGIIMDAVTLAFAYIQGGNKNDNAE